MLSLCIGNIWVYEYNGCILNYAYYDEDIEISYGWQMMPKCSLVRHDIGSNIIMRTITEIVLWEGVNVDVQIGESCVVNGVLLYMYEYKMVHVVLYSQVLYNYVIACEFMLFAC